MQQPPLPHQRFWRWFRTQSVRLQIISCVVLILSCALCTGISAIAGKGNQTTPVAVATTSTTQAPADTPTIAPTATSVPATPTATPKPSIQSQLQSIAQKSGAFYSGGATVTYDADFKYAHVFESFPVTGDKGLDVSRIKHDSYAIQKAIWQAHVRGVDAVQVLFNSDDATPLRIATCEVERTTAIKLTWSSITSDQAWSDYDQTWLSPSL